MADQLTLKKAIELNQLEKFIQHAEAAGVGPADERAFFAAAVARLLRFRTKGRAIQTKEAVTCGHGKGRYDGGPWVNSDRSDTRLTTLSR